MKKLLLLLFFLMPIMAFAQTTDRLPGVIDRLQIPSFPEGVDRYDTEPEKKAPRPQLDDIPEFSAYVTYITISGASNNFMDELHAIAKPYQGKTLTGKDIATLKYKITKAYFDKGYILIKVITPPQDTSSGTLKIQVVEGRIDTIKYHNNAIKNTVAKGLLSRISKGDIFNEKTAESALNDIDDLQNIKAHLRLEPGTELGTTILNIYTRKADEDQYFVEYNNYGARTVSRDIATVGMQKSNVLSLGETINASLNYGPSELKGGRIEWLSPIPLTDFFVNASYTRNDIEVGGRFQALNATGDSQSLRGSILRNFTNTDRKKITGTLTLEHRKHRSFLSDVPETKDTISKLRTSLSYLQRMRRSIFYGNTEITRGIDAFNSTRSVSSMATRSHNPNAWIFSHATIFKHRLSEKGEVSATVKGQYATSKLLASDLFTIGGYASVRGFEPSQATGESGFSASLEYRHNIYSDNMFDVALRPFIDAGAVYNKLDDAVLDSHLYGTGFGVDVDINSGIGKLQKTRLSLDAATTLGGYNASSQQGAYFYASLRQSF
jgi:hemolysin activation/secretion protein